MKWPHLLANKSIRLLCAIACVGVLTGWTQVEDDGSVVAPGADPNMAWSGDQAAHRGMAGEASAASSSGPNFETLLTLANGGEPMGSKGKPVEGSLSLTSTTTPDDTKSLVSQILESDGDPPALLQQPSKAEAPAR